MDSVYPQTELRYSLTHMSMRPHAHTASEVTTLSDFELVRNAEGAWMLIVPALPDAFLDNPVHEISARMEDTQLVLETAAAQVCLSGILAAHGLQALRADAPSSIILSIVDEEGVQTFCRRISLAQA